jgi:3',5'-cyclic AMP phosphodiesterase CpdA
MRTIAHISDLHFGREDPVVTAALLRDLQAIPPHLVAVSGDITQRARRREFLAARAFFAAIPAPRLVVPGNHDIPLYDIASRFLRPLHGYRHHLGEETDPFHEDTEIAVMGVNTARSLSFSNGRLGERQIAAIRERFCAIPGSVFKMLVTHHPFVPVPDDPEPATVGRGLLALQVAESCGVDLLLAGHLHHGFTVDVRSHHVLVRRSMLVAQAGTAISVRTRREPNTYNWITIDPPRLEIETRAWDGSRFVPASIARYAKVDDVWTLG